jgi:hypothetical protein
MACVDLWAAVEGIVRNPSRARSEFRALVRAAEDAVDVVPGAGPAPCASQRQAEGAGGFVIPFKGRRRETLLLLFASSNATVTTTTKAHISLATPSS